VLGGQDHAHHMVESEPILALGVEMKQTELSAIRLVRDGHVTAPAAGKFLVYDPDFDRTFHVNGWMCDCPARTRRCAHAVAALIYETRTPVTLFG